MLAEKERHEIEVSLKKITHCSQDCKHCKYLHIYTVDAGRFIYYSYGCDAVKNSYVLSETVADLRAAALEFIAKEFKA